MPKRRQPAGYRMDQFEGHKPDPLVRVVDVSHTDQVVALAVGPSIRLFNCQTGEQTDRSSENGHSGFVRFVHISPNGQLLLSGSDDKTCKLWSMQTCMCLATWRMNKKLSAGAFTADSQYALFADKFGDVAVVYVGGGSPYGDPQLLLGHLCSIVTSVTVTPDNRFIATADRDGRVRITPWPKEPLKGAYEIQAYCLGHKNFITSAVIASSRDSSVLVTGSGDGSVRVWDVTTGKPLHVYVAAQPRNTDAPVGAAGQAGDGQGEGSEGAKEGVGEGGEAAGVKGEQQEGDGEEDGEEEVTEAGGEEEGGEGDGEPSRSGAPDCAAVLCVAVSRDGRFVAALVEGEHEVQVLSLDSSSHELRLIQKVALPSLAYPCRAAWDAASRLWVVGGPPVDISTSMHVAVLQVQGSNVQDVTEHVLSSEQRKQLERRNDEEEALLAKGELKPLISAPLHRKKYDEQDFEQRKRVRNDTKENMRLAALREQAKKQGGSNDKAKEQDGATT